MNYKNLIVLFVAGLTLLVSCKKENIDDTSIKEEEVTQIVTCTWSLEITENPVGSLLATPIDGTPPYVFTWSSGETTASITPLAEGSYSVTVIDSEDCSISESASFTISNNCQSLVTQIVEIPGGTLNTETSGGTPPYVFVWSTGETTPSIIPQSNGLYYVAVADSEGCMAVDTIDLPANVCQFFTVEIVDDMMGTLTTNINNGTSPYTYTWSTGETTSSISAATSGTYSVRVIDSEGCLNGDSINVTLSACQSLLTEIVEAPAGTLTANTSGGTLPYAYSWSTGETTNSIIVPTSGTYGVTVVDSEACTIIESINVSLLNCQSLALSISFDSTGMRLTANATGGTVPYAYLWSTGESTSSISVMSGNTYTASVTDSNGCVATNSFTVP